MSGWQHGVSAYRNGLCRCDACRAANRDRHLSEAWSRRERTEQNGGVAPVERHNYSTYVNWGCRCGTCHEAQRAYWESKGAVS